MGLDAVEHGTCDDTSMDRVPTPKELSGAGAVAHTLTYVCGLAGVIAGAVLYRQGEIPLAVVAWVLTFGLGAMLMIASFLVRAIGGLLAHIARIESDLQVLLADRSREETLDLDRGRDPWTRHHH